MTRYALGILAAAGMFAAAPAFAQSAPTTAPVVTIPAPTPNAVTTPASSGSGCAWKQKYTS